MEWVAHEGLINKGKQYTISVGSIHLTPDHKILTEEGWMECVKADRFNWAEVSLPYGFGTGREHKGREKHNGCVSAFADEKSVVGSIGPKEEALFNKIMRLHEFHL